MKALYIILIALLLFVIACGGDCRHEERFCFDHSKILKIVDDEIITFEREQSISICSHKFYKGEIVKMDGKTIIGATDCWNNNFISYQVFDVDGIRIRSDTDLVKETINTNIAEETVDTPIEVKKKPKTEIEEEEYDPWGK